MVPDICIQEFRRGTARKFIRQILVFFVPYEVRCWCKKGERGALLGDEDLLERHSLSKNY